MTVQTVRVMIELAHGADLQVANEGLCNAGVVLQVYRGPGLPVQYFGVWTADNLSAKRDWLRGKLRQMAESDGVTTTLRFDPPRIEEAFRPRSVKARVRSWVRRHLSAHRAERR